MPSKKRKYNARFPAGRIKKIMQTDEEVGKVAQAVPIIISRTLELFVESLLTKATQITLARNAKTLSPSHVKQCILAESRFDFLRDLVKNIPDVSAAEEKEMISAENSPNSSRSSEPPGTTRRLVREDSNASTNSMEPTMSAPMVPPRDIIRRAHSQDADLTMRIHRTETITAPIDTVIDLSKKSIQHQSRSANFYQETLITEPETTSVIRVNPGYTPQPSTSQYPTIVDTHPPKTKQKPQIDLPLNNNVTHLNPKTPITPIINIDFSKNIGKPEIKVLDTMATSVSASLDCRKIQRKKSIQDQAKVDLVRPPIDIDSLNSGNLQIDEDYDT